MLVCMKEEHIEVEGRVQTVLPGTMFRVELDNKHLVLATICGKMRKRWVRLTVGDRVKMEMSPYERATAIAFQISSSLAAGSTGGVSESRLLRRVSEAGFGTASEIAARAGGRTSAISVAALRRAT